MSPINEPGGGPGVFAALRRHAILIVACGLLVGAIAAALLSQRNPEYEATAQVLLPEPGPELAVLGTTVPQTSDRERRVTTGVAVMKSGAMVEAVAGRLGDVGAADLRGATAIAPSGESDVVDVTVNASSAGEAARRADAYARTASRRLRADQERRAGALAEDLQSRYDDMSRRQQRTGEGATLRDRLFTLGAIADGRTGGPKVVQRADQATARVDQPQQLIILGVMLGLLVGAGLALLRDRSDRRVRGGEELAGSLDVPVLASVGRSRAIRRRVAFDDLREQDAEVFRFLHGKLRFSEPGNPPRTVLVTSARDGEGKSSVATYLASAASASGARVLLVEADLRRPVAAGWLGAGARAGLVDVLRGDVALDDAVAAAPIGERGVLDVLPAGAGERRRRGPPAVRRDARPARAGPQRLRPRRDRQLPARPRGRRAAAAVARRRRAHRVLQRPLARPRRAPPALAGVGDGRPRAGRRAQQRAHRRELLRRGAGAQRRRVGVTIFGSSTA